MKNNNIFLGFFIIVFAILFLLGKFNFSFVLPIFIIFIGLSIMPQEKNITKIILFFCIIFCLSLINIDSSNEIKDGIKFLPIEISDKIENPNIFLSVEAGDVSIAGFESEKLIQGGSKTNFSGSEKIIKDNNIFLNFEGISFKEDIVNEIKVLINKEKEVELSIYSSLSSIDAKEINNKKIKVDSFLSDINLEIDRNADVNVDSFLSSIRLFIPENLGIRIENNLLSSSTNFDDLIQIDQYIFQTQNYEQMDEHIDIKINGLFSSFKIIKK